MAPGGEGAAFELLLKASMDEAGAGGEDKDEREDLQVDGKWDSTEEIEDDDSDFSAAEAMEDDDDEEYLDTHMQHRKAQQRLGKRSLGRDIPAVKEEGSPSASQQDSMASISAIGWPGALRHIVSLAGTDYAASLDDVQHQFLANLPEALYIGRTKTSEILTLKCSNRECSNVRGNPKKPNSIYCCSKCQSREQNLRQGRVKNVRRLSAVSPISKIHKRSARRNSSASLPQRTYVPSTPAIASPYRHAQAMPPTPPSLRTLPPPVHRTLARGPEHIVRDKLALSFLLQGSATTSPAEQSQPPPALYRPPQFAMAPMGPTFAELQQQRAMPRLGSFPRL